MSNTDTYCFIAILTFLGVVLCYGLYVVTKEDDKPFSKESYKQHHQNAKKLHKINSVTMGGSIDELDTMLFTLKEVEKRIYTNYPREKGAEKVLNMIHNMMDEISIEIEDIDNEEALPKENAKEE